MSKNVFSQLLPSPLAEISNLALSGVLTFLSKSFSLIGKSVGLSEHLYRITDLSHYLCLKVSH